MNWIIQLAILAVSVTYQYVQQQKARKEAKEQIDAARGISAQVSGEINPFLIAYGRVKVQGARVYHAISGSRSAAPLSAVNPVVQQTFVEYSLGNDEGYYWACRTNSAKDADKNEMLWIQQQICFSGVNKVVTCTVDGYDVNNQKFYGDDTAQYIQVSTVGGASSSYISERFPEREDAKFYDSTYATMMFDLNRQDYQYSGRPTVEFFIEGNKLKTFKEDGTLSSALTYSNSPPLCLIDYLSSTRFGKSFSSRDFDLPSFLEVHEICSRVQNTNSFVQGNFYLNQSEREVPLYECNLLLSSEDQVIDNVRKILSTMNGAFLSWSSGKFKLRLNEPQTQEEQDALVVLNLTDQDIVEDEISITYPGLDTRLNQATVRFYNEHSNLTEDTATWPKTNSDTHVSYKEEDNQLDLKADFFEEGITDYYHALQAAANKVRFSRTGVVYKFTASNEAVLLEPGDIITLELSNFQLPGNSKVTLLVEEIAPTNELFAEITASTFDYRARTWIATEDAEEIFDIEERNSSDSQSPENIQIARLSNGNYELSWSAMANSVITSYDSTYSSNSQTSDFGDFASAPDATNVISTEFSQLNGNYPYTIKIIPISSITGQTISQGTSRLSSNLSSGEIESWNYNSQTFYTTGGKLTQELRTDHGNGNLNVFIDFDAKISKAFGNGATIRVELFNNGNSLATRTKNNYSATSSYQDSSFTFNNIQVDNGSLYALVTSNSSTGIDFSTTIKNIKIKTETV